MLLNRPKRYIIRYCIRLLVIASMVSFFMNTPKALLNNEVRASSAVLKAISRNKPILAMESTIITHGLPWPTNFDN